MVQSVFRGSAFRGWVFKGWVRLACERPDPVFDFTGAFEKAGRAARK